LNTVINTERFTEAEDLCVKELHHYAVISFNCSRSIAMSRIIANTLYAIAISAALVETVLASGGKM
jgi:hypothetical protein